MPICLEREEKVTATTASTERVSEDPKTQQPDEKVKRKSLSRHISTWQRTSQDTNLQNYHWRWEKRITTFFSSAQKKMVLHQLSLHYNFFVTIYYILFCFSSFFSLFFHLRLFIYFKHNTFVISRKFFQNPNLQSFLLLKLKKEENTIIICYESNGLNG